MDPLITGIFGLVGAVVGSVLGAKHQGKATQQLIDAEFAKIHVQIREETKAGYNAKKEQQIVDSVTALVTATDPEIHSVPNYPEVVALIHKIQIHIDTNDEIEKKINHWSSALGFTAQAVVQGTALREELLEPANQLIQITREYVRK